MSTWRPEGNSRSYRARNTLARLGYTGSAALGLTLACGGEVGEEQELGTLKEGLTDARLNMMSMNVRIISSDDTGQRAWSSRLPRLAETVRAFNGGAGPHLIAFQEMITHSTGDTAADMWAELPQGYWYYPRNRGDGEILAIFVRPDRLDVLDFGGRDVSRVQRSRHCGTFDDEDNVNRPIQYVYVRDKVTDQRTYFYNVHFPTKHSCGRHGQSEVLAEYIGNRSDQQARVVVAGDFNDGVESDGHVNGSIDRFIAETDYTMGFFWGPVVPSSQTSSYMTCTTSNGLCSSSGNWSKTRRVGQIIDLFFLSDPFDLVETGIDRSMYTRDGSNTRVVCQSVTSNGLCSGTNTPVADLELYSDHWAVWASITQ